jgi:hypothetical protein
MRVSPSTLIVLQDVLLGHAHPCYHGAAGIGQQGAQTSPQISLIPGKLGFIASVTFVSAVAVFRILQVSFA